MDYTVRAAESNDYPSIRALLAGHALPIDDVDDDNAPRFYVAVGADGALLGCAAIEQYDDDALLRSVAVSPAIRSTGIGAALVETIEREAAARDVRRLFLLTTSAQAYFEAKGYRVVQRSEAPSAILESSQFTLLCPASAVCMVKQWAGDVV